MVDPPFRSPRAKLGGLYHFGRMLDKVRCDVAGELPEEYRPNLGFSAGLDGHLCGFLGVAFADVRKKAVEGCSDDEIVQWCFETGLRPNAAQRRVWNGFAEKFGWRDAASAFIAKVMQEDGLDGRDDLVTAFDSIDAREGRPRENPRNGKRRR